MLLPVIGCALLAGCSDDGPSSRARAQGDAASARTTYRTIVDHEGNISLPADYAVNWSHLGTWAVVNEEGEGSAMQEGNGLHHVYTTPDVIAHFRKTGAFPDGAVLVKEVTGGATDRLTTGQVYWSVGIQTWFVMIKDSKGRFPENPLWGDGWGWALYNADAPDVQIATNYKVDCLGCHVPVKDRDWVYTFGYPVLEVKAREPAPEPERGAETPPARSGETAAMEGNAARGKAVFSRCAVCHTTEAGRHKIGPSLHGIVGRKAGTVDGFNYSEAMKSSDVVWTPENIEKHLADVGGFIPGNRMAQLFPVGVPDAGERADIIAYLETLSPPH